MKEKMHIMSMRITNELHEALRAEAKRRNMKVSRLVREAVEFYLAATSENQQETQAEPRQG